MDVAKSGRRGYSSLGIVTPAFMIESLPLGMGSSLTPSVTGSSTPSPFPPFKSIPTDRGCMHGMGQEDKIPLVIGDLPDAEDATCIG